ncbi:MAG: hypothetical protein EHM49_00285 [Deltaproteobacteria bacterium]|nr:MAG: hypothetical protein EHM49_05320 [Deltaproteobacteria bacterium]RPI52606.1 MAG: hypothetical protein EHM49_05305 [Deltaproteobacteria bacterium]RPI56465.1 MAG: hypothetical protein EHM49_00285 [Deltaproteobacteria bacterium]
MKRVKDMSYGELLVAITNARKSLTTTGIYLKTLEARKENLATSVTHRRKSPGKKIILVY